MILGVKILLYAIFAAGRSLIPRESAFREKLDLKKEKSMSRKCEICSLPVPLSKRWCGRECAKKGNRTILPVLTREGKQKRRLFVTLRQC